MKHISSIIIAFLGIIVGILLAMTVYTMAFKKRIYNVQNKNWSKIDLVLDQLDKNYVDTINHGNVTDAAIEAALAELDPHSVYMPPVQLEKAESDLAANFDGIGIQFNVPNDTAIVLEVIAGGPSEKVGLQPGDRILKVDSLNIAGVHYPQDSMVRHIKGPSGSKVNILIGRNGEQIPFEITRGKIPLHSVDAAFMINDELGYIRLTKFSRTTFEECQASAQELLSLGMKKLIFDVRQNVGGYFDQAIRLSNMFLDKDDEIVYMQGLHRKKEDFKADGNGLLKDVKLTVLIDENTASSSEIFAGAMQDNDRGTIVGRRSFGKGLVQEPIYFSDGSGIRLTVARYYTPSGRCIQKPYSDDYQLEIYKRYSEGEMLVADSIKVDTSDIHKTVSGRTVYGGGGIVPDVFVPLDTTRASDFFIACNKKTTQMRFASAMFDKYKNTLSSIGDFNVLEKELDKMNIPSAFRQYAAAKDGITASQKEWEETQSYLIPQLRALIGRYSKLGDNAFYKLYMSVDNTLQKAIALDKKS